MGGRCSSVMSFDTQFCQNARNMLTNQSQALQLVIRHELSHLHSADIPGSAV